METEEAKAPTVNYLEWYMYFFSRRFLRKHSIFFEALLPQFEKNLINPDRKKQFSYYKSLKALFGFALLRIVYNPKRSFPTDQVFIWPFQLHHPIFQGLVIDRLVTHNVVCKAIVFRKDVASVLQDKKRPVELAKTSRSFKPLIAAFGSLKWTFVFLWHLTKTNVPFNVKMALMQSWEHLSTLKVVEAVAKAHMSHNNVRYHLVGHDLSTVGRLIIAIAKEYGQTTGRIQNGAVNYRLAGFSQIDEIFFWDENSLNAYFNRGWRGNGMVIGNILMQEKFPPDQAFPKMNPILIPEFTYRTLVAFSGPGHNTSEDGHIRSIRLLECLVDRHPDKLFIIKLHPKDKSNYYQSVLHKKNVKLADNLFPNVMPNAIQFIHATDLVITGASSVGLDALILDKPVICIDPLEELDHFAFLKEYQVPKIRIKDDLVMAERIFEKVNRHEENSSKEISNGTETIVNQILTV